MRGRIWHRFVVWNAERNGQRVSRGYVECSPIDHNVFLHGPGVDRPGADQYAAVFVGHQSRSGENIAACACRSRRLCLRYVCLGIFAVDVRRGASSRPDRDQGRMFVVPVVAGGQNVDARPNRRRQTCEGSDVAASVRRHVIEMPEDDVYCSFADHRLPNGVDALCLFREVEGLTAIVKEADAGALQLPFTFESRLITLEVDSDLAAVRFSQTPQRLSQAPCADRHQDEHRLGGLSSSPYRHRRPCSRASARCRYRRPRDRRSGAHCQETWAWQTKRRNVDRAWPRAEPGLGVDQAVGPRHAGLTALRVSPDFISTVAYAVIDEVREWQ